MFMKRVFQAILVVSFLFFISTFLYAEQTVDRLQKQAFANIERATELVAYAQKLVEVAPTRDSAERCVELYLEAALLYGNAARFFKAMGPSYVSQDIVDQFSAGERNCLKAVDDIRRQLNKGQVVGTKKDTMESLLKQLKEMSPELSQ